MNEVDVPRLVGQTVAQANSRLAAQPLTPQYVYEPAKGRASGSASSCASSPREGTLSSYDKVTLVLPKALHGVVPRLIGLRLARAQARLERLHLKWKVDGNPPPGAKVIGADAGPAQGRGARARRHAGRKIGRPSRPSRLGLYGRRRKRRLSG